MLCNIMNGETLGDILLNGTDLMDLVCTVFIHLNFYSICLNCNQPVISNLLFSSKVVSVTKCEFKCVSKRVYC